MELLTNDLSIHGQFSDIATFRAAVGRVMTIRQIVSRFGRELYCHRNIPHAQVTRELSMLQVAQRLTESERRALMHWLTQLGPFWEDTRFHGPDDYLEHAGAVVTDTAVGEAAFCCLSGIERHLVSLIPSSWQLSPVMVSLVSKSDARKSIEVLNHWDPESVEALLQATPAPIESWQQLETIATVRCSNLTFSASSFDPLLGLPFSRGAAQRILARLETLHRLRGCVDERGERTSEGHWLYQNHFTGDKAWFSDSSDTEKHDFRPSLTFPHPMASGRSFFCPWHGKVKTPQLRIHFTWPVDAKEPLYVVYVGPKITKR